MPGSFTLHIRGVGGWTNRLYSYFEEEYKRQQGGQDRDPHPARTQPAAVSYESAAQETIPEAPVRKISAQDMESQRSVASLILI